MIIGGSKDFLLYFAPKNRPGPWRDFWISRYAHCALSLLAYSHGDSNTAPHFRVKVRTPARFSHTRLRALFSGRFCREQSARASMREALVVHGTRVGCVNCRCRSNNARDSASGGDVQTGRPGELQWEHVR